MMTRAWVAALLIAVAAAGAQSQNVRTLCVPEEYDRIQDAIFAARDGDTVLVREGVYHENINFLGKAIVVASAFVRDGDPVHVLRTVIDGGWSLLEDSASVVYAINDEGVSSVLCGFTVRGGRGTVIDDPVCGRVRLGGGIFCWNAGMTLIGNRIVDNSVSGNYAAGGAVSIRTALTCIPGEPELIKTLVLDGNTFEGNTAVSSGFDAMGGAVLAWNANVRVSKNTFSRNTVQASTRAFGGALWVLGDRNSHPLVVMQENEFRQNVAISDSIGTAGAAGLVWTGNADIHDNTFTGNEASGTYRWASAGALLIDDIDEAAGSKQITGNVFSGNASVSGGAVAFGGACEYARSRVTVRGNSFLGNAIVCPGTGEGSAIREWFGESCVIDSNVITGNVALGGPSAEGMTGVSFGAVRLFTTRGCTVSRNVIAENVATQGGGLSIESSDARVENNVITRNRASEGGGIHVAGESMLARAPVFVNNTVFDNTAAIEGAGMSVHGAMPIVLNTIFWNDTSALGSEIALADASVLMHYSDVAGGWDGEGNLFAAPMLVDDLGRLSDDSPCIGAGAESLEINRVWYHAPRVDFSGRERPAGDPVSIGAHHASRALAVEYVVTPGRLELQASPNPLSGAGVLRFSLPAGQHVLLAVYDVRGVRVATLMDGPLPAGYHAIRVDASSYPAGVYFCTLHAGEVSRSQKMCIMR